MRCSFFPFSATRKNMILSLLPLAMPEKFDLIEKIKFILHKSAINWNYRKFSFAFAMEISFQIDFSTITIHIH